MCTQDLLKFCNSVSSAKMLHFRICTIPTSACTSLISIDKHLAVSATQMLHYYDAIYCYYTSFITHACTWSSLLAVEATFHWLTKIFAHLRYSYLNVHSEVITIICIYIQRSEINLHAICTGCAYLPLLVRCQNDDRGTPRSLTAV